MVDALSIATAPLGAVFQSTSRLFWIYLLSAAVLTLASTYRARLPRAADLQADARSLWGTLKHPSALRDYAVYFVNASASRILPWLAFGGLMATGADAAVFELLSTWMGPASVSYRSEASVVVLSSLATFVAADLTLWLVHYLQHRIGCLWELHKVHHSAEVLTPISAFRVHPFDDWLNVTATAGAVGATQGALRYVAGYPVEPAMVLGLEACVFAFYLLGFNLRHSHVWLSYPPWLSRVLISPAQHQIHHSVDPVHHDKNFGFALAVWDALAGTLYVPRRREELRFGLHEATGERHRSLVELYVSPVGRACARVLREASSAVAVAALVAGFAVMSSCQRHEPQPPRARSLFLEQLTWDEVKDRIDSGFVTVLVPTGGVEQNGFHLALGKHNAIVEHTAGEIARELGETLVAPVITLSPEGAYSPPSEHMRWSGTISLPDEVFEAVLESVARSLKAHGFRLICFVGDSGGNQEPQRRVADRLSREWGREAQVLHVSDYYDRNGQFAWLRTQGEVASAIGTHAGIRDTSELLAVDPSAVRPSLFAGSRDSVPELSGSSGDPTRASADRGVVMLRLKIEAASAQIRRVKQSLSGHRLPAAPAAEPGREAQGIAAPPP